jgi:hypothetical protein
VRLLLLAVGASIAALWLNTERTEAVGNLKRAEEAEQQNQKLWDSFLAQAQAARSQWAGRRAKTLEALAAVAALRPSLELRNEAVACLTMADMRLAQRHAIPPSGIDGLHLDFDRRLERCAHSDGKGVITIRRLTDNQELFRLAGPGDPAWVIQFSRDGRFLAARHHRAGGNTRTIHLWDLNSKAAVHQGRFLGHASDFSHDPKDVRLAAAQTDRSIIVYTLLPARNSTDWRANLLFDFWLSPLMDAGWPCPWTSLARRRQVPGDSLSRPQSLPVEDRNRSTARAP